MDPQLRVDAHTHRYPRPIPIVALSMRCHFRQSEGCNGDLRETGLSTINVIPRRKKKKTVVSSNVLAGLVSVICFSQIRMSMFPSGYTSLEFSREKTKVKSCARSVRTLRGISHSREIIDQYGLGMPGTKAFFVLGERARHV